MAIKNLKNQKNQIKEMDISRIYEEFLKPHTFKFVKKRKVLSRKDVVYPSHQMKSLEDMKRQIDPKNTQSLFKASFKLNFKLKLTLSNFYFCLLDFFVQLFIIIKMSQSYQKSWPEGENKKIQNLDPSQFENLSLTQRLSPSSSDKFFKEYQKILSPIFQKHRSRHDLVSELKGFGINYDEKFTQNPEMQGIRINSLNNSKHFQVIQLEVSVGPFTQNLLIFNTFRQSTLNSQKTSFEVQKKIIPFKYKKRKFCLKFFKFCINNLKNAVLEKEKILSMVKEVFFGKILSVLKIGPRLASQFGFDIFVTEENAFFIMEFCQKYSENKFSTEDGLNLKKNLKEMHSLSILHRDIKPDNIMYSQCFKKFVFIDFGSTDYFSQKENKNVETRFVGTYSYVIEDMKKLLQSNEIGWVNLHFNDAFGLQKSISEMKNCRIFHDIVENFSKSQFDQSKSCASIFFTEVQIKYALFANDPHLMRQIGLRIENTAQEFFVATMNFLYEIPLSENIRQFYHAFFWEIAIKTTRFEDLKQVLDNKTYFEFCKGKRQFQSENELKTFQNAKIFYKNLFKISEAEQLSIEELEYKVLVQEILFLNQKYLLCLIDFLNVKRMKPFVSIQKKLLACRKYIELQDLNFSHLISIENTAIALEFVFHDILSKMTVKSKLDYFSWYQRALENYLLLSYDIDIKVLDDLVQFINFIHASDQLSFSDKIEHLIILSYSMSMINENGFKLRIYQKSIEVRRIIEQKTNFYINQSQKISPGQNETNQIYEFILFVSEKKSGIIKQEKIKKLTNKINELNPFSENHRLSIVINYIRRFLINLTSNNSNMNIQLQENEEKIFEQMEINGQFNVNLIKIILESKFYNNLRLLKKALQIYDECLQIQLKTFTFQRLSWIYYSQKSQAFLQNHITFLANAKSHILNLLTVSLENIFICKTTIDEIRELDSNLNEIQSRNLDEFYPHLSEAFPKIIELYQVFQPQIWWRESKNAFYLDLLHSHIRYQINTPEYLNNRKNLTDVSSFNKIVRLDKSGFTSIDQALILRFQIIYIKMNGRPSANQEIFDLLQTISQNMQMMPGWIRVLIFDSIALFLSFLQSQADKCYILSVLHLILYIRSNISTIFSLSFSNVTQLVGLLIEKQQFQPLFEEIISYSTKYLNHNSFANIIFLTNIFSVVAKFVKFYKKEKPFYQHLKHQFIKINPKIMPLFNLFLILCIRPFNRKALLKLIVKCLDASKYFVKYLVLSKLYKEFMKVESLKFLKKKKVLSRKDVIYPSHYMKTLKDMKRQIDPQNDFRSFKGVFLVKIQQKIIKLGKCCQVYSEKKKQKTYNIIKHNHYEFRDSNNSNCQCQNCCNEKNERKATQGEWSNLQFKKYDSKPFYFDLIDETVKYEDFNQ